MDRIEHGDHLHMDQITDEERRRDSESEALCRKITEEDPGCSDRVADRILAEIDRHT
jgi:hypothetical protein